MGLQANWKATGIGSLPYQDAKAALDITLRYLPEIPPWPQLPKRNLKEGMLTQFIQGLPCLKVGEKGAYFDTSIDKENELAEFYKRFLNRDIDYFAIGPDYAQGFYALLERLKADQLSHIEFIKGQVTGPFSLAASLKGKDNKLILYDPTMMEAVLGGLAMKALWQIKRLKEYNKKAIIFFDEPYLGSFGSAYTPISRKEVVKGLTELISSIRSLEQEVILGIHCCGNTDWSMLIEVDFDILSFDAYSFIERLGLYPNQLKDFLKRGGILAWGIVSTTELSNQQTPEGLIRRLDEGINSLADKGVPKELLLERALLSPSCGMGTLSIEKAERILNLLSFVSSQLRKRYLFEDT